MTFYEWLALAYVVVFGACVGSFLNVVVYRLPLGKSLVAPPSSCPFCGHRLAWYDNIPVLGWLLLRGKCRYCQHGISVEYPLIEAVCAVLFAGLYLFYFVGQGDQGYFAALGIGQTWIVLVVQFILLAGLLAATLIDARLFIIPLQIPWFVTVSAVLLLPASVLIYPMTAGAEPYEFMELIPPTHWFVPLANGKLLGAALGGTLGLVLAVVLLQLRVLPLSFADEMLAHDWPNQASTGTEAEAKPTAETDINQFPVYPHARREMAKELLFLAFPLVGAIAGIFAWNWLEQAMAINPPDWTLAVGGVLLGYLVGGATVWGTRVFGTLLFGREAMGLGDVHLLAAIGAVLGAKEAVAIFFIAPFFGLAYAMLVGILGKITRWRWRMIPYGPFLAMATIIVILMRQPILHYAGLW